MYSVKFSFLKKKQSIIVAAEWIEIMQIMQRLIIGSLISEVILKLIFYLAYLSDHDVTDYFLMWKKKSGKSLFSPIQSVFFWIDYTNVI